MEILTASGADWLIFELIDGIRGDGTVEEPAEALQRARYLVREGSFGSTPMEQSSEILPHIEPLSGDRQIDWAVEYISKRLDDSIRMLISSLDDLSGILADAPQTILPVEIEGRVSASGVTLVL